MFRFTIRDVLWLMVVVALGIAFILERQRERFWRDRVDAAFRALSEHQLEPEWSGTVLTLRRDRVEGNVEWPKVYTPGVPIGISN